MSKQTEQQDDKTPQTWDELKRLPLYESMPELIRPQELTVSQSVTFEVTRTRVFTRWDRFNDTRNKDVDEATILLGEIIEYADLFFQSIAKDKATWDEWLAGRDATTLFSILIRLVMFYADQLGKSNASKLPSESAE